jgi:hypothetical protein
MASGTLSVHIPKLNQSPGQAPGSSSDGSSFTQDNVPLKRSREQRLEGGHSIGEFLRQFSTVPRELTIRALEEAKDSLLARIA